MLLVSFLSTLLSITWSLTILVDPGHGGEDHGASRKIKIGKDKYQMILEKDLTLALSKRIHKGLNKKFSAYLTRSVDRTIPLQQRAQLADKIKADLFISVHVNSSEKSRPRGFETYYLDNHKDSAVKKVEMIENKKLEGEDFIINKILTDLVIKKTVKSSYKLAKSIHIEIQKAVGKKYKLKNRGVRPGLFFVLVLAKRPAVLLEVGFLSNDRELKKILNPKFQEQYAQAVVRGIEKYINSQAKGPSIL